MIKAKTMASTLAFMVALHPTYAETPITSFDDIAGKWSGPLAENYRVTLRRPERQVQGRIARRRAARQSSRVTIVIQLPQHQGTLQLILDGETLGDRGPQRSNGQCKPHPLIG
jgi:hypothetical protein